MTTIDPQIAKYLLQGQSFPPGPTYGREAGMPLSYFMQGVNQERDPWAFETQRAGERALNNSPSLLDLFMGLIGK